MRIRDIRILNFRAIERLETLSLGAITVLVGANGSGKSSLLRAIHQLQEGAPRSGADIRLGCATSDIHISATCPNGVDHWRISGHVELKIDVKLNAQEGGAAGLEMSYVLGQQRVSVSTLPSLKSKSLIVPFLSNRKTAIHSDNVGTDHFSRVTGNLENLSARLLALQDEDTEAAKKFSDACQEILGVRFGTYPAGSGMRIGLRIDESQRLHISQLGEGVPHVVGLLLSLYESKGRVFLIEELENDLHPQALRRLLDVILERSTVNQFLISTHSNIVVRHLCSAEDSILYKVSPLSSSLPLVAKFESIGRSPDERIAVMRELGYSFSDLGLWEGWLILEESSAETIIRKFLIPYFVPDLANVQLLSAGGVDNIEPTLRELGKLVLFAHLEKALSGVVWVCMDGDGAGKNALVKLKSAYPSWREDRFISFSQDAFERYYPAQFQAKVAGALQEPHRETRRNLKRVLLLEVVRWLQENPDEGKIALSQSAGEIVEVLERISEELHILSK